MEDYELICVNDGSTDGSLNILRRYEQEYENVTVIDQENGGVCRARNAGLRVAKGEYIWYIDADDFIEPNSLKELQTACTTRKCDRLVIGNYQYIPGGSEPMCQNKPWKDSVVWRSMFRKEFLIEHNLLFHYPELSFGEDALFMYEVKRELPLTYELTEPIYYHRDRPGSLSTDMNVATEIRRLKCTIREAQIMKDYYEQGGILEEETSKRFYSFLRAALYRLSLMSQKEAKPFLRELKDSGLFPYKQPQNCVLIKCPGVERDDSLGKLLDFLYTTVNTRWGYCGMCSIQSLFWLKQKLLSPQKRG